MWTNICTTGICLETFLSDAMKWDHFTGSLRHFCIISFRVSAIRRVPNGTMHTITMVKIPQFSSPFFWTIHTLRQYIFRPFLTHPLCQHKYRRAWVGAGGAWHPAKFWKSPLPPTDFEVLNTNWHPQCSFYVTSGALSFKFITQVLYSKPNISKYCHFWTHPVLLVM